MGMLTIERLIDPVLETRGTPVTSRYVEVFWLPILGPTATWLIRHVSYHTVNGPYEVEADELACSIGVAGVGPNSPLMRALRRLVRFHCGVGRDERWALLARLDTVSPRRLLRLPETLQLAHEPFAPRQGENV